MDLDFSAWIYGRIRALNPRENLMQSVKCSTDHEIG